VTGVTDSQKARELLGTRGRIPVFPLPNVVFFPHAALPLHIFEPRYRAMIEDALRGDRVIAVALLKPGWEDRYHGSPDVCSIACAGLIEEEARLPDGRFNIRLRGLSRLEILEFVQDQPYRVAAVRLLQDLNEDGGVGREEEKRRLLNACASLLQEVSGQPGRPFAIDGDIPLASVVNSLCQNLSLEPRIKQGLLETGDVILRCRSLIDVLNSRWQEIALLQADRDGSPAGGVH
jgi:uncharacterized protein